MRFAVVPEEAMSPARTEKAKVAEALGQPVDSAMKVEKPPTAAHIGRIAALCRKAAKSSPDRDISEKFVTLAIDLEARARKMRREGGNGG